MLDAWVRQRAVGFSPVKFRISTVFGQMAWSVLIPGTAGETDERIVSGVLETPEDLDAFVRTVLEHSPEGTVILGSYAAVLDETLRSLIPCANGIPDGAKERLSEHMRQTALTHLRTPDPVTIYTDASSTASRTGVGLGWVIVGGGLPLRVKCRFLPNTNHILIGEVMAIMYGLKSVVGVPELGTVVVRSDSKGAVRLLTKCWKGESVRGMGGCHEEFQQLLVKTRQLDVRFEWVKGHNGNVFNEAVDRLAMGTRRNHQMDLGHLDSELMARVTEDLKHE
ncbi:MAG: ribonuclease HI [Galactobacter sp.]